MLCSVRHTSVRRIQPAGCPILIEALLQAAWVRMQLHSLCDTKHWAAVADVLVHGLYHCLESVCQVLLAAATADNFNGLLPAALNTKRRSAKPHEWLHSSTLAVVPSTLYSAARCVTVSFESG
jgi:hypothetical protein